MFQDEPPAVNADAPQRATRSASQVQDTTPRWNAAECIAFRFFFVLAIVHLLFNLLPTLIWTLPSTDAIGQFWFSRVVESVWQPFVQWLTRDVLGLQPAPYRDDMPAPPRSVLVGLLAMVLIAATATAVWTIRDRGRAEYRRLYEWLRVYLRFALGALLLSYGLRKVMLDQFGPEPSPSELVTPVGGLGPFSMLVVFMAASPLYQVFTGAVEVLAGLLLLVRRTARIGAVVALAVMVNVVILNFAYHFTMYVLSMAMLVMASVLAAPELGRVLRLLVFNRPVQPPTETPLFANARYSRITHASGTIVVTVLVVGQVTRHFQASAWWREPLPLAGVYEVVEYAERPGGSASSSASLEQSRWRQLLINPLRAGATAAQGSIVFAGDTLPIFIRIDSAAALMRIVPRANPTSVSTWSYAQGPDRLILEGSEDLQGLARQPGPRATGNVPAAAGAGPPTQIRVTLRRIDGAAFPLLRPQPWFR